MANATAPFAGRGFASRKCVKSEFLTKTPVIELVTEHSGGNAKNPSNSQKSRQAARASHIVGKHGPPFSPPPAFIAAKRRGSFSASADLTAKPAQTAAGSAAKARQHGVTRYDRRKVGAVAKRFAAAVEFAFSQDWPLTVGLTITWTALQTAGERNEGHCLGRGEWAREKYARDELARMCRSAGLPFVCLWGRDVGQRMGSHVHLGMFQPSRKLPRLVALIERITGAPAAFVTEPYAADVAARSTCGGWQIDINNRRDAKQSTLDWVEYIESQHAKHPTPPALTGKAFGISQAIGPAAQARARRLRS